jgi:AcrR family transcriptional regulator
MKQNREEKVAKILSSTIQLLSEKGYDNMSIVEIADHAQVYKSLLHYYFKDKEELVSTALATKSSSMIQPSKDALSEAKSADELIDGASVFFKKDMSANPDFFGLIFETWCAARRSKKIKEEFNAAINHTVGDIKIVLENANKRGFIDLDNPSEIEAVSRIILALYHGLALQLIHNPRISDNQELWDTVRRLLMASLS